MTQYRDDFYQNRHRETYYAASKVLDILCAHVPTPRSAVDVGCGVGTWLAILQERGADEIAGIDGPWVNRQHLRIPSDCFTTWDLSSPLQINRRFDLAISLEVAEHLPVERAPQFVETLTGLADTVLFSAAMPFQEGEGHVNEQWPEYWAALFRHHDYGCLDLVRPRVWDDRQIPLWYRQNTLVYVKREMLDEVRGCSCLLERAFVPALGLVHPSMYLRGAAVSVRSSLRLLRMAAVRALKRRLGLRRQ